MPDLQLIALIACATFGWTIEYVLGLTLPQFMAVAGALYPVASFRAAHEILAGIAGAFDAKAQKELLKCASVKVEQGVPAYTAQDLRVAEERMARIMAQRSEEEKHV